MEETTNNMPIMYVFVRKDIPYIHQAVQASHAVAKFLLENKPVYKDVEWTNGTMVFLRVKDEDQLLSEYIKLSNHEGGLHTCAVFMEPDWQITPVCTAFATIGFRHEFFEYKTVRMPLTLKALLKKWKHSLYKSLRLVK